MGISKDVLYGMCQTPIYGKNGATYARHGAFCLSTQAYPDALHQVSTISNNVFKLFKYFQFLGKLSNNNANTRTSISA